MAVARSEIEYMTNEGERRPDSPISEEENRARGAKLTEVESHDRRRDSFENEVFRVVVEQTGQLIYDYDTQTGKIAWAGAVEQVTGFTPDEFALVDIHKWAELIHVDDRAKATDLLEQAELRHDRYRVEYRFRKKNGDYIAIEDRGVFVASDDGDHLRMLGTMSDVTQQRALESQVRHKQKLESLGVLAGGIAHDFNNLLTTILGSAEILRRLVQDSNVESHLDAIAIASRRAGDLCRQLLTYAGKARVSIKPLDLNALLNEIPDLLKLSLPSGASLELHVSEEPLPVEGSVDQLRQVILNLVLNAGEALDQRGGVVTVRAGHEWLDVAQLAACVGDSRQLRPGRYALVSVTDNGCGIDAETMRRIFDPFFTTKFTGRGLGLAAVQGIVASHGGGLLIDSTPGQGSTFTLLLPTTSSLPPPTEDRESPSITLVGTVLVIDDDEMVRGTLLLMLEHLGLSAVASGSGEEGLSQLTRNPHRFTAAILDWTMPGLNGGETLRLLRQIRPDLPVLLCTGYSEMAVAPDLGDDPATLFLGKPFTISKLQRALQQLLEPKRARATGDADEGPLLGRSPR